MPSDSEYIMKLHHNMKLSVSSFGDLHTLIILSRSHYVTTFSNEVVAGSQGLTASSDLMMRGSLDINNFPNLYFFFSLF